MKIIIREEQYRIILEENFKSNIVKKLDELKDFTSNVIDDLRKSFNFNVKFGITYGVGIGVILSHIIDYLQGKYTSLTDNEIKMLAMAAIMVVFYETKDVLKLEEKIDSNGLSNEFADVTTFTDNLKLRYSKILKSLGMSLWRGTDILGYAFLLPIIGEIGKFLNSNNINDIDFEVISKSISISTGIIITGHILRRMFDKFSKS